MLLDLLFPKYCLGCKKRASSYLCDFCLNKLVFIHGALFPSIASSPLRSIYACVEYRSVAKKLVTTLKYRSVSHVSKTIGNLMIEMMGFPEKIDFLIPIPLHHRRYKERGFNQAKLLSNVISFYLHTPVVEILQRTRYTTSQASLHRKERLIHLKNAFRVYPQHESCLQGKIVVLVDDVSTTGATLHEAAVTLQQYKPKAIFAIVFAYTR